MDKPKFMLSTAIFFPLSVIYMELLLRIFSGEVFFNIGLLIIPVFSAVFGLGLHAICSLMGRKAARIVSGVVFALIGVVYMTQIIYYEFFNNYMILYSITAGGAGQLTENGIIWETIKAILKATPIVLFMSAPSVIIFTPLAKFIGFNKYKIYKSAIYMGVAVLLHIIMALIIALVPSLSAVQSGAFNANSSMTYFGLLRTEVLDIKYNLFEIEQNMEIEEETDLGENEEIKEPEPVVYTPNVMDIDFDALKESETDKSLILMNEYFSERTPTLKNEYTGMYKGYNLVSVVAEGFSPYAIDPVLTPTLYKMQQDGFKFNNYYTPIWGVSTSDGEYSVCTGLIPKAGVWSFYRSSENYMPFCLGNMFGSIGVNETYAYHNNTHTYYRRHLSHPNMGYNYKGMGTGVEKYVKNVWPQSDLEMVSGSTKDYLASGKPFHAYYMTVSGHLEYSRIGNSMSAKNWSLVKDLDCSDTLKAYYACNIELDRAMEKLLIDLNEAGVADKTVISITPDHYPYGLEKDEGEKHEVWTEMLGHKVETTFELYESCWLLYCPSTKNAPATEKPCYSIDILPTLLNLFGFEYDSRLLMGSDVLSTSGGLVIFNDRSFITDLGKYNSKTGEFTPFDQNSFSSKEEQKEYVEGVRGVVSNKFKMSKKILEEDYYRYLFK